MIGQEKGDLLIQVTA